jgi:hypothetical protein
MKLFAVCLLAIGTAAALEIDIGYDDYYGEDPIGC